MEERASLTRRLRAADLFARGWTQAQIARELGVTRTTAMRWQRAWQRDGRRALARGEPAGRPPKLESAELSRVLASLPRDTTVEQIADAIAKRTGVRYHPGHLWRLLKAWGWAETFEPGPSAAFADPDGNELSLDSRS